MKNKRKYSLYDSNDSSLSVTPPKKTRRLNDKNIRYYIQNDFPKYHDFGKPDFIDLGKRHYRLAYNTDSIFNNDDYLEKEVINENDSYKLYIKIPRKSEWFDLNEREIILYRQEDTALESPLKLNIDLIYKKYRSKTGYIYVSGRDIKKLLS